MSDNVFVIPATIRVGAAFPPYLPLADGSLKPIAECTQSDVGQAIEECRSAARASRARLEQAYAEHVQDLETLAHMSAYLEYFERWSAVREGGTMREVLWHVDTSE